MSLSLMPQSRRIPRRRLGDICEGCICIHLRHGFDFQVICSGMSRVLPELWDAAYVRIHSARRGARRDDLQS